MMVRRLATLAFALCGLGTLALPAWATCPATPDFSCRFADKSSFTYSNSGDDTKDKLGFKLSKGAFTPLADFGDPTTTDSYELCLYAGGSLVHTLAVAADGDCGDDACWSQKTKGPVFKDKLGASSGITSIALSTPADMSDKTAVKLKGKGIALADISIPMAEPIVVELRNSLGNCWIASFRGADQVAQDPAKGKIKLKSKVRPICSDGIANGLESDADCGEVCGIRCDYQESCVTDSDCTSNHCVAGQCNAKRVFVSSGTFTGNLGGVAGADVLCNGAATAASLGGTWTAMLSITDVVAGFDRIGDHGYKRLDGVLVLRSRNQLNEDGAPSQPINLDEYGAASSGQPWTGSNDGGYPIFIAGGGPCAGWTSADSGRSGTYGSATAVSGWGFTDFSACSVARPLYCFEN